MMRFCKECNNLLYPRESRERKKLEYACRPPCTYVDRNIEGSMVFINELIKDSSTRLEVILSDVNKDPTLQRTKDIQCVNCGHNEAVFFQVRPYQHSIFHGDKVSNESGYISIFLIGGTKREEYRIDASLRLLQ
jgi:DNA-directed RNA polymerase II subunit RPB9